MEITKTNILPLFNGKYDCIAVCEITIDNAIEITGLKLYLKDTKYWLVFPKNPHNKKKKKFANPVDDHVYQKILDHVVTDYCNLQNKNNSISDDENNFYKQHFGETPEEEFDKSLEEYEMTKNANEILSYKENIIKEIKESEISPEMAAKIFENLKNLTVLKKEPLTTETVISIFNNTNVE